MQRRHVLQLLASAAVIPAINVQSAFAQSGLPPKTLRMVTPELVTLTSATNTAGPVYQVAGKIFDGLVNYDMDFKMTPQLATAWEISEDWQTISFTLRPGVTWHDGTPFTSADVAWSALNVWKVAHPRGRSTFESLIEVETPDDLTAIFKFEKPSPVVAKALHAAESQILPKHLYEGTDLATNPYNAAPVGTGPFKFVAWERGSHVELEKYDGYWNADEIHIDRVVVRTIPEASARSSAFEAQEVDIGGSMPVALSDARRLETLDYLRIPTDGDQVFAAQAWIEFNTRRPYLEDVRVRKAIAYALDRDLMIDLIWQGFGTKATGPISPALAEFYTDQVTIYEHNIDEANRILDEAGYPAGADGIRFKITHDPMPIAEFYARTGEYFKQALRRIGIDVELRSQDYAAWITRLYTDNDFDSFNATSYNMPDPCMGVKRYFWSKNIASGVPFSNGSGYSNPEVDALFEAAQNEMVPAERVKQFHRIQEILTDELPQITIANIHWFTLENTRVTGADTTPYGIHGNLTGVTLA